MLHAAGLTRQNRLGFGDRRDLRRCGVWQRAKPNERSSEVLHVHVQSPVKGPVAADHDEHEWVLCEGVRTRHIVRADVCTLSAKAVSS